MIFLLFGRIRCDNEDVRFRSETSSPSPWDKRGVNKGFKLNLVELPYKDKIKR